MTDRELGATGARVSSLCMGCWEIGGLSWGPMSSLDAVDLVRAAFDAGITTFDTAEQYGGGRSETVLGKALEGMRHETVIVTKVGYLPGSDGAQDLHLDYEPQDFSPARIQQACDLSLRRLRTTYLDALLLHDPPLHIVRQADPFEALRRLQQAGKIRWWGVSASPEAAAEAIRRWDAPVVESPFSLADDGVGEARAAAGSRARHGCAGAVALWQRRAHARRGGSRPPSSHRLAPPQGLPGADPHIGRPARPPARGGGRARRTAARDGHPLRARSRGGVVLHRRDFERAGPPAQHPGG